MAEKVDYLVQPSGDCVRWSTKCGAPTHYCFSVPYKNCPSTLGCTYSQYKPIVKRMLNKHVGKLGVIDIT